MFLFLCLSLSFFSMVFLVSFLSACSSVFVIGHTLCTQLHVVADSITRFWWAFSRSYYCKKQFLCVRALKYWNNVVTICFTTCLTSALMSLTIIIFFTYCNSLRSFYKLLLLLVLNKQTKPKATCCHHFYSRIIYEVRVDVFGIYKSFNNLFFFIHM